MKNPDIKKIFETIAGGYDFQNRLLSLGIDTWWRKKMVQSIQNNAQGLVLDMATGTAEVALEIVGQRPNVTVIGGDFSPNMLRIGTEKIRRRGFANRIRTFIGDARKLPFKNAQFDAITIAFGIRNIREREKTLGQFYSVLKPGGQLIIMEFGFPRTPLLGPLYHFYFNKILPRVGDKISRTGYAYSYLANSVHEFPVNEDFIRMIEGVGFQDVKIKKLTLGIAVLFMGKKSF
ncbi:MAG: bifunctional demethylmenaquinone methyltransferase/2-methoxy-6-polyprenyl-1,4-benzoquinol methylase UbiE [Deltaproteobacteria bacterium]|nr:bifunctional demethylmenaquinone methyltransferase/2-methoxy-6-polyprenyl-1,4-benzoquinol methylase UbiE [Deltaproteobacteria bacterium]